MDLLELLRENEIELWEEGKNVSTGWIGLQCPFCGDESNHLGINLSDYSCRCWKCGHKTLTEVLKRVLDITWRKARTINKELKPYTKSASPKASPYGTEHEHMEIKLPAEASSVFPSIHMEYLKSRGFGIETIKKYRLKAAYTIGPYKFRIIIPIIHNGSIVSFTSRDVTGKAESKYKAANKKNYPNPKDFIYNLDTVQKNSDAILVEGPTDVWRLGDRAISLFGITGTSNQFLQLHRKKIRRLYLLMDNDKSGNKAATTMSKMLFPFVKEINIVRLKGKNDPGELLREEAEVLMRKLKLLRH